MSYIGQVTELDHDKPMDKSKVGWEARQMTSQLWIEGQDKWRSLLWIEWQDKWWSLFWIEGQDEWLSLMWIEGQDEIEGQDKWPVYLKDYWVLGDMIGDVTIVDLGTRQVRNQL